MSFDCDFCHQNVQMYEEKEELVTIIKQAAKERLQMEKQLAKIRPNPVSQRLWGKFMVYISRLPKFLINGSVKTNKWEYYHEVDRFCNLFEPNLRRVQALKLPVPCWGFAVKTVVTKSKVHWFLGGKLSVFRILFTIKSFMSELLISVCQ